MAPEQVLVLDAARSPFGARGGELASVGAEALVAGVVVPLVQRAGVLDGGIGATWAGGPGVTPALAAAAARAAGGDEAAAVALDHGAASGMTAIGAAARAVATGAAPVALAVAVARMSDAPAPEVDGAGGAAGAAAVERTQSRWLAAYHRGAFVREVLAVAGVAYDEHPVAGGFADGAAAVVLGAPGAVPDAQPLARVVAVETLSEDELEALPGRLGWGWDGVDLIELHEPSGAGAAEWLTRLGERAERVNVDGGSLAIGDPAGVTGARLVVSLADLLRRREGVERGLAILPVGDGVIHVVALAAPPR